MKDKKSLQLFWCLFLVFTTNTLGKISFSAATVALVDTQVLTKTQAGFISGAYWLVYAVGQIMGGFLVNRMSAYTLINISIVGTVLSNLFIANADHFLPMLIIWLLGSVSQFGMWPAVLKLVSEEIVPKQRMMVMGRLAFCYCLGSVLSHIFTACLLKIASWRYIFVLCGLINAVMLIPVIYANKKLSPVLKQESVTAIKHNGRREKLDWSVIWSGGLVFFSILIVIKSIVETGIKNWMPTIMTETYGAPPSYTSFLSVILLGINIFGVVVSQTIYNSLKCDELKTLWILYGLATPMLLILLNYESMNIMIVTVLMSLITLLLYGSGQIIQMNYVGRFNNYGLTATIGGIINCFAAVGNVIANYSGGYIADHFGWGTMIIVWNVLIVLFIGISVAILPMWTAFRKKM